MSRPLLLCTDLDGTLIPDGRAPEPLDARPLFARLAAREEVRLAFVTGRHRKLVEEAISELSLPLPRFVVGDVGSTIYEVEAGGWRPWDAWRLRLEEDWPPGTAQRLRATAGRLAGLELQEASKQSGLKVSFYLRRGPLGEAEERLRRFLEEAGIPARLVSSRDSEGVGLLDLLPPAGGKLGAVEFLIERGGFDRRRFLFAGDSGNDLEVLVSGLPAVLVANAGEDVRRQARDARGASGDRVRLYEARGGFRGMNGNYAAGVLEGLAHFLPAAVEDLR